MLTPNSTGYVAAAPLNIAGAWFAYGDDLGMNGAPPGNCETMGMLMPSQCSLITSPPPAPSDGGTASFPPDPTMGMCMSGTAAKVINDTVAKPDYSNIFGIGIGLDFNNPAGTALTWDSTGTATPFPAGGKVTGFSFTVSGLPTAAVRVEFDEPSTEGNGDAWAYTLTGDGPVTVNLSTMIGNGNLSPSFTCTPAAGSDAGCQGVFDPTMLKAIQFHVVTDVKNSYTVTNFCINDLAAIVCM